MAQARDNLQVLVRMVMNLQEPNYAWNFLTIWGAVTLSGMP